MLRALPASALLLAALLAVEAVSAQTTGAPELQLSTELQKPHFRQMSVNDGLPENSGVVITQDSQGFLWIGTIFGLVRYDGHEYKTFQSNPADSTSLVSDLVIKLYEDSDGDLVVGTNNGLSILDRDTNTFDSLQPDSTDPTSLAGVNVNVIFEDSRGNYWVGSAGNDPGEGALQLFDKGSRQFIRTITSDSSAEGSLSDNAIVDIAEDKDGILWIATYGGGLNRYDWRTDTFTAFRHIEGDPTSLASDKVIKVYVDRYGILWAGTGEYFGQERGGALNRVDPRTGKVKRYLETTTDLDEQRSSSVGTIAEDANGTLWVGSVFGGLSRYERKRDTFTTYQYDPNNPESLSGQSILAVYSDRSGVLWAGSWSDGISALTAASSRFPFFEHDPMDDNSLASGDVMTILEDSDGIIWIGTDEQGLTRFDRQQNQYTRFMPGSTGGQSISHPFVRYLFEDSAGIIWIGTFGNGLDRYDRRTNQFTHFRPRPNDPTSISHGSVRAIFEDSRGEFWVGTWGGGLNRMDRSTGEFTSYRHDENVPFSLPDDQITAIDETADGRVVVSFNNVDGIYAFDRETEEFHSPDNSGGGGGRVFVDSRGRIWRTGFGGLHRLNDDLSVARSYKTESGLASAVVTNIVEAANGSLWVSHERGLALFNPEAETFRNYTSTSGLRLLTYTPLAVFASRTGELFFGGRGGFHAFFPDRLADNTTPPPVVITELRINNQAAAIDPAGPLFKDIARTESISLPYDQNDLGFTFAALHYENPDRNLFRYQLEGYDEDWIDSGTDRTATYTNLSPGRYTLKAIASNSDGVWNEDGVTLSIRILPPWWRTGWAYGLYLLAFAGSIFGIDRYQRRRLVLRERERAKVEQAELRAANAESQSKLLQADNERKRNIELLGEIGRSITSSLSTDQIIETVYENVNDLMDASVFGIGVLNAESGTIDFPASKEKGQRLTPFSHDLKDPNRLSVQCLERREEIIIRDYEAEYRKYVDLDLPPVAGESPASVVYLPLIQQDKPVGVLTAQSFTTNAYSDYQINILRSLASYAAIAIDNADAYRKLSSTFEELKSAQAQLVHQEKLASLGELTAGIAHEIKNPLNFVNNFAEVGVELYAELRESLAAGEDVSALLDDIEQGVRQIAHHGKRADGIVRSMMMHASGGGGKFEPTDLNGVVKEFVDLAYHGKRARSSDFRVTIETDLNPDVGKIDAVPQDIGRVLVNLVGNAFDAVVERSMTEPDFMPVVRIASMRNGKSAVITVADNGAGIDESIRDKIFDPFFTTKAPGSGTGLGLSLSYDIVTKTHGGEMTVDSQKGVGTTFTIKIPVSQG